MWARVDDGDVVELSGAPPSAVEVDVDEPILEWVDEDQTEQYTVMVEEPFREEVTQHVPVPNPDGTDTYVLEQRQVMVDRVRLVEQPAERTVTRRVQRENGVQRVTVWRSGVTDPAELADAGWYEVQGADTPTIDPALQRITGEPAFRFHSRARAVVADWPVEDIGLDELRATASARAQADADARLVATDRQVLAALEAGQRVPDKLKAQREQIRTALAAELAAIATRKRADFATQE